MTIIRQNGKVTTTTRALKRDRRRARRSEARQTSERHLADVRLQAFNYNAKQSRRWLQARLLSENRGFITKDAASQLAQHFLKTEQQLQKPRITDTILTADAKGALFQLELERGAAREEQGHPNRVQDWWPKPAMSSTKKGKGKKKGKKNGVTASRNVNVKGLGDEVEALVLGQEEEEMEEEMEEEEGAALSGEEFKGFVSPVMMSPTGSVVGGEDEE